MFKCLGNSMGVLIKRPAGKKQKILDKKNYFIDTIIEKANSEGLKILLNKSKEKYIDYERN